MPRHMGSRGDAAAIQLSANRSVLLPACLAHSPRLGSLTPVVLDQLMSIPSACAHRLSTSGLRSLSSQPRHQLPTLLSALEVLETSLQVDRRTALAVLCDQPALLYDFTIDTAVQVGGRAKAQKRAWVLYDARLQPVTLIQYAGGKCRASTHPSALQPLSYSVRPLRSPATLSLLSSPAPSGSDTRSHLTFQRHPTAPRSLPPSPSPPPTPAC